MLKLVFYILKKMNFFKVPTDELTQLSNVTLLKLFVFDFKFIYNVNKQFNQL